MYNYKEVVKDDVRNWIAEHKEEDLETEYSYDTIYDSCFVDDNVTGNASGSYTFNRWTARENFFEDPDAEEYLERLCDEFGYDYGDIGKHIVNDEWEWIDVSIRCLLLAEAVSEILEED